MENNEVLLRCPYCDGTFKPTEILFYANADEQVANQANESGNPKNQEKPNDKSQAPDLSSLQGQKVLSGSGHDTKHKVGSTGATQVKETKDPSFPLGSMVEDTIAVNFIRSFDIGANIKFSRRAVFYAIKQKDEIQDTDIGYGYVDIYERESTWMPHTLKVKDTDGSWRSIADRVCPKCHCDIPSDYFITPKKNIHEVALAGGMSAGKTQFMIVALRELMVMLYQLNLGYVEITKVSKWFFNIMVHHYVENGNFKGTPMKKLFPLILQVNGDETHFLVFHDCAGEYTKSNYYLVNLENFKNAEMLLLMIDSAQFFGKQNVNLNPDKETPCEIPYEQAIEPLNKFKMLQELKEAIVVMTKCDGIFYGDYIHDKSEGMNDGMIMVTTNMNEHKNAVDMGLIDRVERELLDLLDDKGKANVKETLEKKFNHKPVKLLGVSTYVLKKNGVETKMESIPDQEVGHFRLIEPLLYMMVQMGIIKGEVKSPKQIGGGDGEDDEPPRRWWKRKGRKV